MIRYPRLAAGLFAAIALVLLVACSKPAPTPEPEPTPPAAVPTTYTDSRLGFSFQFLDDWHLASGNAPEGQVASVTSPDGAVLVQVIRDLPPPVIDLPGYGKAMTHALKASMPGLQVQDEGPASRGDGSPSYRAGFTVAQDVPQSGELLVVFRGGEAFMVQAAGPQGPYQAWTPGIRIVLDSFRLTPIDPATPTP